MKIPKKIFLFWHSNQLPTIVRYNIIKIKQNHPDYEVILLNKENYKDYINFDKYNFNFDDELLKTLPYFSDILRIFLLVKYGGIWLDSSLIVWKNLSNLINEDDKIVMFENPHNSRQNTLALESWFIAAIPKHPFIIKVKEIMLALNNYTKIKEFVNKTLKQEKIILQKNMVKFYHLVYHIFNYVCQKFPKTISNIHLHNSDDAFLCHNFPNFMYPLNYTYFNNLCAAKKIMTFIEHGEPEDKIVSKMTGNIRRLFETIFRKKGEDILEGLSKSTKRNKKSFSKSPKVTLKINQRKSASSLKKKKI